MSQPRGFFETIARKVLLPEESDVQAFLAKSEEFRAMKEIASAMPLNSWKSDDKQELVAYSQHQVVVKNIQSAQTFSDILHVTERLNAKHEPLKRFALGAMLTIGGYFNQEANFAYYMLHLREKADAKRLSLGYELTMPTDNHRPSHYGAC